MFTPTVYDEYNPHMNTVQLMVPKVLTFNENTELLPSGDFYNISLGNNDPINHSTLVLVRAPLRKISWVEVAKG